MINSRVVRGRCPCGAEHAACGPPSASTPVDESWEVAVVGGALKRYTVTMPGGQQTVMKLNEADAKRYGVFEESKTEALKATQDNSAGDGKNPPAKRRAASNKARSAANKDGGAGGGDD